MPDQDKNKKDKDQDLEEIVDDEFLDTDESGDADDYLPARLEKLKAKLKTCETERQEYLAGWQRSRADYVNLKVTEEKAKHEIVRHSQARLLLDFLKVADSFEMAFANKEAWEKLPANWRQGMEYIHAQLGSALTDNGVTEINPLHQEFDPKKAHSIGLIETEDKKMDNIVMEVLKKGYELHGQVIRPAQVKVGKYKE